MRTITQRIPNLLLGVSQQPDLRKFPGQVVAADNVFPDYALGMLKRPGGKYVSKLVMQTLAAGGFRSSEILTKNMLDNMLTTFFVFGILAMVP